MNEQTMVGKVRFLHAVSGTGMVVDQDGIDVFFHARQLPVGAEQFQAIVPGKQISFVPEKSPARTGQTDGWRVKEGTLELVEGTGITHDPMAELKLGAEEGYVRLRIDAIGRMVATDGKAIKPSAYADGYVRAYAGGYGDKDAIKGFNLTLPEPTADLVVVLADYQKRPRNFQQTEYERINLGSYIAVAHADGRVQVYVIGIRQQPLERGHHAVGRSNREQMYRWVVIHNRFEHTFDPASVSSETEVLVQIPSSGMKRDNDGFATMVAAAFERMREVGKEAETIN